MSRNSWKMCDSATGLMARVQLSGEFGHQRNQSRSWKDLSICRHFLHNFYLEMRSLVVVQIHPEQKKWCHDWGLQILTRTNISSGCHKCSKKAVFYSRKRAVSYLPWFRIGCDQVSSLDTVKWFDKFQKTEGKVQGKRQAPLDMFCHSLSPSMTNYHVNLLGKVCVCVTFPKALIQSPSNKLDELICALGNETTKPHSEQKQTNEVNTYCSWFSSAGVQSGALIDTICPLLHSS